jgi:Asp-tRNA(Asn)/Glu-tRNA(Gln) amidotransferase A subunit family amidase
VKDVIDVAGLATRHNSPLGDPRPALNDAPCVAVLRAAGAVILGKTDTTEFAAAGRNAATANPHDLERTPGGSSSGSAAAVADGHVPIALTTQTGGSTIRPASFCGIHALKPTWGAISREGAKIYANSLDTIGLYARSVGDLDLICEVFAFAAPAAPPLGALRIGVCRTPYWDRAEPETVRAMERAETRLAAAGCEVTHLALPPVFDRLEGAFKTILFREGGVAFLDLARTSPDLLHADFHERVASRERCSDDQWRAAYDDVADARRAMEAMMAPLDAVLAPSAPGVAPKGRGPGDPIFNQMWTLLHLPCVNLPLFEGPGGLPLGLTLTAPRFQDRRLLRVAAAVEEIMGAREAV